jgi:hypothetical protein
VEQQKIDFWKQQQEQNAVFAALSMMDTCSLPPVLHSFYPQGDARDAPQQPSSLAAGPLGGNDPSAATATATAATSALTADMYMEYSIKSDRFDISTGNQNIDGIAKDSDLELPGMQIQLMQRDDILLSCRMDSDHLEQEEGGSSMEQLLDASEEDIQILESTGFGLLGSIEDKD